MPGCDALPILEPAEHALDDVSEAISPSVERVDNVTGSPSWNDWLDLSVDEPVSQPVGAVEARLVRDSTCGGDLGEDPLPDSTPCQWVLWL